MSNQDKLMIGNRYLVNQLSENNLTRIKKQNQPIKKVSLIYY